MNFLHTIIDFILHLDKYLNTIIDTFGVWTYVILFLIIFVETGVVIMPFLPGDSLIFAAGTFSAIGNLNVITIFLSLWAAAVIGDTVNYEIGKFIGSKIYEKNNLRFIKKEHLDKTNKFYEKHGGLAIIIARFMPIIRTFAPFVAGIGKMNYSRFLLFNAIGGGLWVGLFSFTGFLFGNLPFVKQNFSLIAIGIILVSVMPAVIAYIKEKRKPTENSDSDDMEEKEA